MNGEQIDPRIAPLPYLGTTTLLKDVANDNDIEDVIIALSTGNSETIANIVSDLEDVNLRIHVLPNLFSILSGQVTSKFSCPAGIVPSVVLQLYVYA